MFSLREERHFQFVSEVTLTEWLQIYLPYNGTFCFLVDWLFKGAMSQKCVRVRTSSILNMIKLKDANWFHIFQYLR
jgi:hypothetical protein